jgi:predicted adenine nucleotide alpha hydrolase (AANH) superfamily ATPase
MESESELHACVHTQNEIIEELREQLQSIRLYYETRIHNMTKEYRKKLKEKDDKIEEMAANMAWYMKAK